MNIVKIKEIKGMKQLSSMGNETIKVSLVLDNDHTSSITVPAGISAGKYEAKNVSVEEALSQIESVKKVLLDGDWDQESLDARLPNLNLGGNTSIAISAAFWKAVNIDGKDPVFDHFPKLLMLLFEGGKHGNPTITMQEFLLIEESLENAISDYRKMRHHLADQKIENTVGAEGGFSPMNFTNRLVLEAIKEVFPAHSIGLDAAGSFRDGDGDFDKLLNEFNVTYLEDPYSDEDWGKWAEILAKFGSERLITGDDLTVTSPVRIRHAAEEKAINAVIIKPNQNGTITGTLNAVRIARENNLKVIVSHRGEETADSWIVDLALTVKADYVKFGGINRGERIAKYNRLLELGMK